MSPIGAPGPVWVSRSLCSLLSIRTAPREQWSDLCRFSILNARSVSDRRYHKPGAHADEGSGVRIRLCGAADVAIGGVIKVETQGLSVAVFNLDGEYFVTDDACT